MGKDEIAKHMSAMGRKGGLATGKSKRRGGAAHYRKLAEKRWAKRQPFNSEASFAAALAQAIIEKQDAEIMSNYEGKPLRGKFKRGIAS